jgi:hypothetical protein
MLPDLTPAYRWAGIRSNSSAYLWPPIWLIVYNGRVPRLVTLCLVFLLTAAAALPQELIVQRAGQPPRDLSRDEIAAMKPIIQQAAVEHVDRTWSGPLLWDVLVAAHAVDPAKPADAVHLGVRVIGADGWTAVFGLAELSPEFASKPIQLADQVDGTPIAGQGLRLIVPGEHRGGRSVRDVVRIDIE